MTRSIAVAAALALGLSLSGCVSLCPKAKPVNLYRLEIPAGPSATPGAATAPISVLRAPTAFSRVASGDKILTTTGVEAASIAGARWAAPVQLMFDEQMSRAFDAVSSRVRLATRGEAASSDMVLRVEVRTFEARYSSGPNAAPTVVVEAHALLTNLTQRQAVAERLFRVEQPAADNRVGPIVEAFDAATGKLLGDLANWTADQAKAPTR